MACGWRETSHPHYFWIGLRHCADRVIFPVGGISGRPGEFLFPSLGIDSLPFAPQIIRSTGPLLFESKMAIHWCHGPLEETKGKPGFPWSRSCVILQTGTCYAASGTLICHVAPCRLRWKLVIRMNYYISRKNDLIF